MMEELLGLTPGEYQYYSDHLSEWNSVKGDLIYRLEKKYPNESDRWFPEMFNLSPTDFNSKQPSDFENWYNKWHELSGSTEINSVKDRIHAEGYQQWKNPFKGQQNFAGARAKGRGFGTSKGFS